MLPFRLFVNKLTYTLIGRQPKNAVAIIAKIHLLTMDWIYERKEHI